MNISQRLRTGLDAVIELLQEAADEIDALRARAQVQGEPVTVAVDHFDNGPFEAHTNRIYPHVEIGTKLYTTPQPAHATQAEVTDASLIRELVDHIERNTCTHEETHRGGAIWEVCDSCGARWADDAGGKPGFKWPAVVEKARAILALRPERVPMTERELELIDGMIAVQLDHAQRCDAISNRDMAEKQKGWDMERVELLRRIRSFGITAQAKKETPCSQPSNA